MLTRVVPAATRRTNSSSSSIANRDTLFKEDFSLTKIQERFCELQEKCEDSCLLLSYQCKDEGELLHQNWESSA